METKPLEDRVRSWRVSVFGPNTDMPGLYSKLVEEVGELGEALMRRNDLGAREEIGDVAFVLMGILRVVSPEDPALLNTVEAALAKNMERLENGNVHKERVWNNPWVM